MGAINILYSAQSGDLYFTRHLFQIMEMKKKHVIAHLETSYLLSSQTITNRLVLLYSHVYFNRFTLFIGNHHLRVFSENVSVFFEATNLFLIAYRCSLEISWNAAHVKELQLIKQLDFYQLSLSETEGPYSPKKEKHRVQCSHCWLLTFDMCADCLTFHVNSPCNFFPPSIQILCNYRFSQTRCCQPSFLQEDLHPPKLLKATQGFPHGNFYTSWQVAQTPGLHKTRNDDWERVRSDLKTCWVASFGVCRKAG